MAKFEKCPEKGCIHYRIHSDHTYRFPKGVVVYFASKQGGRNLLRQGERTGLINADDAQQIRQQIETTLGLPETHPADQRHSCTWCYLCRANSTFVLTSFMALEYMDSTVNEPVN